MLLDAIYRRKSIKYLGIIWLIPIFVYVPIDNLFFAITMLILPIAIHYHIEYNTKTDNSILWFLSFLIYAIICSLFSNNLNADFTKYFQLFIEGFLAYFIVKTIFEARDIEWLSKWIVFFSLCNFLISYVMSFYGLGKAEIIYDLSSKTITNYYRPIPPGFDPNYYYLHLILPFMFCLTKFRETNEIKIKYFYLFITLIVVYGIASTASKSAMLISIFLYVIVFLKTSKHFLNFLIITFLFLFIGIPIFRDILPYTFFRYEALFESFILNDTLALTTNRSLVWERSWVQFLGSPIFGTGLGQMVKQLSSDYYLKNIGAGTTHNGTLHTLAEMGIIGAFILFYPFIRILRKVKLEINYLYLSLIGTLLMLQSIDAMYYKVIYVLLALCLISYKKKYV